jgi:pimeloyl-ACP methyl ester carboxylesterase
MAELLVPSTDGTVLRVEQSGEGPPLVVMSGALFPLIAWRPSLPTLSRGRSVFLVERRGRGKNPPRSPYAPEREVDDLLSVLKAIAEPADLLGHSAGAILALQTAARFPPELRRLVVYEPPVFFRSEDQIPRDLPERIEALVAKGDIQGGVATFFREGPRVPEAQLERLQAAPYWSRLITEMGHTAAYDARVQRSFVFERVALAQVTVPTLMLIGSASPDRVRLGSETIASALPNARIEYLEGQEHTAMVDAPVAFGEAVNSFLNE